MAIRVLRIIDRLNVGGPAKHVVWLTAGLNGADFESVLITGTCAEGEGDMMYFAQQSGVDPIIIPQMSRELGFGDVQVVVRLVRELFRFKPDIVHTHKSKAGATGRAATLLYRWLTPSAIWLRPRRCHVVHTYHGHIFHSYYGPVKSRLFAVIERLLARYCTDRIITLCQQQQREICDIFHVGQTVQHCVIPLGIEFKKFGNRDSFREELGADEDELLVGIVGRLTQVKNHAMFLESAARLIKDSVVRRRCRFIVIGDGELRGQLELQTKQLDIDRQIVFTGFRRDIERIYPAFDVVALTSLNEGTPVTLLEAMSCGQAVVATEVGGVPDLMGDRCYQHGRITIWQNGVTVPSQDSAAFSDALEYLLVRPELRRSMGTSGSEFVKARFSRERLVKDLANLYQELLHE